MVESMLIKFRSALHDISNKLAVIIGNASMIRRKQCENCPNLLLVDNIITSCHAMTDLLNANRGDLKSYLDANKQSWRVGDQLKIDSPVYNELMRLGNELQIQVDVSNRVSDLCDVELTSDTSIGCQIVHNIFHNAKKANTTRMRVVAVEFDDHVAIRFVDDGDGMSSDTISCLGLSIASKTSTGEGTGIIKRLVNQGGAAVEWSSAGIGAGSCVTIRFQKQAQMEVAS